jgi:hypothetical protein
MTHTDTNPETADALWGGLYRAGGVAALAILALMPVQLAIYFASPPPETVEGFFARFRESWLLGLLNLDLLYLLTNVLMLPLMLALSVAVWRVSRSAAALALMLSLVSLTTYFASNPAFEVLALSGQHAAAATEAQRSAYLAAGEAMLATYKGTAFDVYYVMNGVALLILSALMLRGGTFDRATAFAGLLSGVLMMVPSTAGTLGLYFSLASLVPWAAFSVLVARALLRLGQGAHTRADTLGGRGPAEEIFVRSASLPRGRRWGHGRG